MLALTDQPAHAGGPDLERARDIFEQGRKLYYAANYADAIKAFEAGYALVPRPLFLANIAQAYRQLHEPVRSRDYFRRFLDLAPNDDPQRSSVEQIIAELDREIANLTPAGEPPSGHTALTPDEEVARTHFAKAGRYYEQGSYESALKEFETARTLDPRAAFDYDIARCHDRLGEWAAAVVEYERFLADNPAAPQAEETRERIRVLRHRMEEAQHAFKSILPASSLRTPAIVLGASTIVVAAVGTGAYLSVYSEYSTDRRKCAGQCDPATLDGLRSRITTAQVAGGVLWGLAAATAIVDVAFWTIGTRRARQARRQLLSGVTF